MKIYNDFVFLSQNIIIKKCWDSSEIIKKSKLLRKQSSTHVYHAEKFSKL